MKILLLTDSYPPEIRSASHLMQELAEELTRRRHRVYVVTAYPGYNLAETADVSRLPEYSEENGVKVLRVKTLPHHLVGRVVRGVAQLTMPYLFLKKIEACVKDKADVVIVYSPPITLARVGVALKSKFNARFLLNVQDIFPQNAIDLGMLKNKWLIRFFESMEKKAYATADEVLVHSHGNREFLASQKNVEPHRVHVVHNWVDVSFYADAERTGRFRRRYGLDGEFLFVFAGVMGPSQGLDLVIKVAERVKKNSDIRFLFVGDGTEKPKLEKMVKNLGLRNVIFAPFVDKREYPQLLKDADVGLVSLTDRNRTPVVPGKILGYMAAGIPVLAFLQKQSDAHELIRDVSCGYSTAYGNLQKAADLVLEMYEQRDTLKHLGTNGAKYASEVFSIEKAVDKVEALFCESPVACSEGF